MKIQNLFKKSLGLISSLGILSFLAVPAFAQTGYIPSSITGASISSNPNALITTVINFLFIIVGLVFFIMIVIAGIQWITSGDAEDKKSAAQKRLVNAIIGIVIVVASYLIVEVVSGLLGVGGLFNQSPFQGNCSGGTCTLNSSF